MHGHKASIHGCTPKWQGAGCWVLGYTQASTATATLLRPAPRLLSCWSVCAAGLHPSMPACQQLGVLACWGACQQHRQHFSPPPSLAGHRPACQHANMPTTGDAGMLGCTPVAQIDQHSCPPPSLAGHQPACQHASMPACQQLGCWYARVHASSTDTPEFLAPSWSAGR